MMSVSFGSWHWFCVIRDTTSWKLKPVRTAAKALNALSAFSTAAEDKARERGEEVPAFTL